MTRIEFIFNVEDKLAKAADLCEKVAAKGRQLTIAATNVDLFPQLQAALWQSSPSGFLPLHALHKAQQLELRHCPIHFYLHGADSGDVKLVQDDVLIHFLQEPPHYFGRFRYLVELVGFDEQDKLSARTRFKFYRERGYEIRTTDMAKSS